MEEKFNNLFLSIRNSIFQLMEEKKVDIDILAFNLGISRQTFLSYFSERIADFTFYLQTLSLLENWEG